MHIFITKHLQVSSTVDKLHLVSSLSVELKNFGLVVIKYCTTRVQDAHNIRFGYTFIPYSYSKTLLTIKF